MDSKSGVMEDKVSKSPNLEPILFPTMLVKVQTDEMSDTIRGMLSWDSEYSLLTEECRKKFNLPLVTGEKMYSVDDLGGAATEILGRSQLKLTPYFNDKNTIVLDVLVVNKINKTIPSTKSYSMIRGSVKNLKLADPLFDEPGDVDLLTGLMVSPYLMQEGRQQITSNCHAVETTLGWVISGKITPVDYMQMSS